MAEEVAKNDSAAEGEASAPLEAVMKEQIDKEVDAAFPAKDQPASPAHALGADDEAASDAEAQKVLLDEVAAASVSPSPSGEGGSSKPGEGLTPKTSPAPSDSADPLAAGRAASAEAVSAAERQGLIEKPPEPEAKPAPKPKSRSDKAAAKADESAATAKPSKLAAVFHLPGSLLATVLEIADRPFTWIDPEVRNVLGVVGLVILGVSAALIILRLKSLL